MYERGHVSERSRACSGADSVGPGEYHTIREPEGPAFTIPGARRGAGEAREVTAGPGEYHGCGLHTPGTAWTMGQKLRARVRLPLPRAAAAGQAPCIACGTLVAVTGWNCGRARAAAGSRTVVCCEMI